MLGNEVTTDGNGEAPPAPPVGPERDLYPVPEAAVRVGISERQLWRLIAAGEIEVHKVGTRTLISPEAITAFKARTLVPATPPADAA
jgi:excisionase family DNA binding protein